MRRFNSSLSLVWAITLWPNLACRTQREIEIPVADPISGPNLTQDVNAPVLQKVVGALTTEYPENRQEVCSLIESDLPDLAKVKLELINVKTQELQDGFILTGVIPSIQYFGFISGDQVLLSEISDKKRRIRLPANEQGNASLDYLTDIIDQKCGAKDARP